MYSLQNRRGVATLIRKESDIEVKSYETDQTGRIIQTDLVIEEQTFTVINIYAPNNTVERKSFFLDVHKRLHKNKSKLIVTGDFNNIINTYLDRYPVKYSSDVSRKTLKDLMLNFDLIDIWRERNPKEADFSCNRNCMN